MLSKRIEQKLKKRINTWREVEMHTGNIALNVWNECADELEKILNEPEEKLDEIDELPEEIVTAHHERWQSCLEQTNTTINKLIKEMRALKEPGE